MTELTEQPTMDDAVFYEQLSPNGKQVAELFKLAGITARQVLLVGRFLQRSFGLTSDMDTYIKLYLQYMYNGQALGHFNIISNGARAGLIKEVQAHLPCFAEESPDVLVQELSYDLLDMTRAIQYLNENTEIKVKLAAVGIKLVKEYYEVSTASRHSVEK